MRGSIRFVRGCWRAAAWVLVVAVLAPLAFAEDPTPADAFALEVVGGTSAPSIARVQQIPSANVSALRLLVREPIASRVSYGTIYVSVNGESANTVTDKFGSTDGFVATINLTKKPYLRLHAGKNAVEVTAVGGARTYYASFVIVAGRAVGGETASASVEALVASSGTDREPPRIFVAEPSGPVSSATARKQIEVRGTVVDRDSKIASVLVGGQPTVLTPASASRALVLDDADAQMAGATSMEFRGSVVVPAAGGTIVVEAKDAAGNIARVSIPVRAPDTSAPAKFTGRKFAVVVGISRYANHELGLHDLRYCDADARSVVTFLKSPQGGAFAPADIDYLENDKATLTKVVAAIERVCSKAKPEDLVLFYLAGHGAADPESPQNLYFLMHDTKVTDMANTALAMPGLQDLITLGVRAERVIAFVDTCHSSGLGQPVTTSRGVENNLVSLYAERLFAEKGAAILTSSDINEVSSENERWGGGHGVFTFALLEGLSGRADTNGDALVTAGELFGYVRDRVRIATSFAQNPRASPGLNAELVLSYVQPGRQS